MRRYPGDVFFSLRTADEPAMPRCSRSRRGAGRLRRLARWLRRKGLEGRLWCHDSDLDPTALEAMRHRYLALGGSPARWSKLVRKRISQLY